jgi:pimeloyl-ACP methyl ester carboxylesterase
VAQFKRVAVKFPHATVMIYAAQPLTDSERPVVVFLHGALRRAELLAEWGDRLADVADVVLADLPGHGASDPIDSGDLPVLADLILRTLQEALAGRRVLLVGESVGGTIALAIAGKPDPGPVRAVFAADPPLTTAKQWLVHRNFRDYYARHPEHAYAPVFGRDFLGILPEGVEERVYSQVLGALKLPTVIAAGDVPLAPPRNMDGLSTTVWDEADSLALETTYPSKAEFVRLADSGHLLLVDAPDGCLAIIKGLLAEHLAAPDGPEPV